MPTREKDREHGSEHVTFLHVRARVPGVTVYFLDGI